MFNKFSLKLIKILTMDFNTFVFPRPKSSYTVDDFKGELIWIPNKINFNYRDKLKYNNYKSLLNKTTILSTNTSISSRRKSVMYESMRRQNSLSMAQRIPSVSFSIDNKFTEIKENIDYIPCLHLKSTDDKNSNKILLYFHANYEDIGYTYGLMSSIVKSLRVNVLSVEYPGYGVYKSSRCSSDQIIQDANMVFNFLTNIMNIPENNILVMGRCIGSGPATHLATKFNPLCLILVSPIKSIRHAVNSIFNKVGVGWMFQKFIKER